MNKLALALVVVSALIVSSSALSCLPCNRRACWPIEDCRWGVGTGMCGCCDVCLQGPGDDCGGPWGMAGHCGEDLFCEMPTPSDFNSMGQCKHENFGRNISKRSLASTRRQGLSQIRARVHSHNAYSGIPEHIKLMLRARGYDI